MSHHDDKPTPLNLYYPFGVIYPAFVLWLRTDFKVLPQAGGSLDQDTRIMSDFYELLSEYYRLKRIHETESK